MSIFLHFFVNSFKWQFKSFLIAIAATLFSLTVMTLKTDTIVFMSMIHFYIVFFYSLMTLFSISAIAVNNNPMMSSSFSGKYLQALPISKLKLILVLAFGNIFSLVPAYITLAWISFIMPNLEIANMDRHLVLIERVSENFGFSLVALFMVYLMMAFGSIRQVIEFPRRTYNRSSLANLWYVYLGFMKIGVSAALVVLLFAFSQYLGSFWYSIVPLAGYCSFSLWRTYRVFIHEELSYWKTSRELALILSQLVFVVLCAGLAVFFIENTSKENRKVVEKKVEVVTYENLHEAAKYCSLEEIKRLLENNSDVNKQDKFGDTPLMVAAQNSCTFSSLFLVGKKSDLTVKNKQGQTASDLARSAGNHRLYEVLKAFEKNDL